VVAWTVCFEVCVYGEGVSDVGGVMMMGGVSMGGRDEFENLDMDGQGVEWGRRN